MTIPPATPTGLTTGSQHDGVGNPAATSDLRPDHARRTLLLTWACVLAGILMLVFLSQRVERTSDERAYQLAGRELLKRKGLHVGEQLFQGPLILLGTQLTDDQELSVNSEAGLLRARLGMLVFPALLLIALTLWSRRALGERAGLITAFLAATNPTFLAYGPLLSSDIAFTATTVLASWFCWRWLQRPSIPTLVVFGVMLGATMATKYTGALTCAALGFSGIIASLMGFDAWPSRTGASRGLLLRLLGATVAIGIAAAIALGFVYSAYLFASPPFSASSIGDLTSSMLRAVATMPLGSSLLGLLPEPMVLGIDHQANWSGLTSNGFFLDKAGNHWGYYPLTVLCKTPIAVLLAAAVGVFVSRRQSKSRGLWVTALVPPLAVLVYCSATRALQMGIRYVLPVVPALLMLASAALSHPSLRGRIGQVVLGLVMLSSSFDLATSWPHHIGFFNQLAGGQTGGARLFADGNCDWEQRRRTGRDALLARHPNLVFLGPYRGPRFGAIAIYNRDLKQLDPRNPSRAYHWISRFESFDHDGAAWLAFDVTPADFEAAIASGDDRAAEDLAVAWLQQNRLDKARQAIQLVPVDKLDPVLRRLAALIENIAAVGEDQKQRDAVANDLTAAGYPELALTFLDQSNRQNAVKVFWLLTSMERQLEGIDFLEKQGADGSRTLEEVFLIVASLCDGGVNYSAQPLRALELMNRGPKPDENSPAHGPWLQLMARVRTALDREARLETDK